MHRSWRRRFRRSGLAYTILEGEQGGRQSNLPQAVNGPGIDWSSGRVGVPELSLEVEGEWVLEHIDTVLS